MEQRSSPPDSDAGRDAPELCPSLPEDGINNPSESMVRRFFVNLGLAAFVIFAVLVGVNFLTALAAPRIPFSWERRLAGDAGLVVDLDARGKARRDALRRVGEKLAAAADFPDGMEVVIHYNPGEVQNAFATFGGNIVVYDGLLNLVRSEDGLAMVLAHEMMHIKHRDSARGVMRAAGLLLFSFGIKDNLLNRAVLLGVSGYSREQEERADLDAVKILGRVYGHAGGAEEFLSAYASEVEGRNTADGGSAVAGLGGTHPDTLVRLRRAREEAVRLGIPVDGKLTPLPGVLERGAVVLSL